MKTIRSSESFSLVSLRGNRWQIHCRFWYCIPHKREITSRDADYLRGLNDAAFNSACVLDFGCGVFSLK